VADATLTFAAMKPGLARAAAAGWCGTVGIGSIGAPAAAVKAALAHHPGRRLQHGRE
jgi:hypothetical protein